MSLNTTFVSAPYFDDFDPQKDFYKILFQPGVTVQTRELNQLQTILQQQIERFGDAIFQTGTIVSGCNFQFYNPFPYIKIKDIDFQGFPTIPARYLGYNVKNETTGLRGIVVKTGDGFESTAPDLKTLYLSLRNTGTDSNSLVFAPGDVLNVFDPVVNGIETITVVSGGIGFSNVNPLVSVSQLVVSLTSGSLVNGDYFVSSTGANVEIIGIDSVTLAASNQHIIAIKPRSADLANGQANSLNWTISAGESVSNPANTITVSVIRSIGAGLTGSILTDSIGTVTRARIISKGQGYSSLPFVSIRSVDNSSGYLTLDLSPQNFVTKVIIAAGANSVGNGYAFGVTEGVIYQKGYFLRVNPQLTLISKYDQLPDNTSVGFVTSEQVIDSNIDPSLLDNVNNTQNEQAPGANRLRLVPELNVLSTANALVNAEFFSIVEWKDGRPVKQNQRTDYSVIGDEMATRTKDSSGNFVTDPFLVTTRSPIDTDDEGDTFNIVIDPGNAYIDGYHVQTTSNFNIANRKGTDTSLINNHSVSLNYGNYVVMANVAGTWGFGAGDSVNLYDTAKGILADPVAIEAASLTPGGNIIGTANIRMFLHQEGTPGTYGALYRLYLFNLRMSAGKNFKNIRSVYYNGTKKGVGDIVTQLDPTTNSQVCALQDPNHKTLLFYSGVESLKNANACIYTYRTISTSQTVSNGSTANATLVLDISATTETFSYSGALSNTNLQDIYVVPTVSDLISNNAVTGTLTANATSPNTVGVATSFLTDFTAGDWVTVAANSTGGADLRRVVSVTNNTFLTLSGNCSYSNTLAKLYRTYPLNVPVPFGYRSGLTANVNVNQNILTLEFGTPFSFSGTKAASVAFNVLRNNVTQLTKTPNRTKFIRICCSNNTGNTIGPWTVGVPDVFRVTGVYVGNSTVSNTGVNFVRNFYVDHNQNTDYYNLSYLYQNPSSKLALTSSDYILLQFDYFTHSDVGFFDAVSYRQTANATTIFLQDSQPLSNLAAVVNSFEIPEVFSDSGQEIDLIQYFDFRPTVANTVAPGATPGTAPLNPSETVTLSLGAENKFPLPDTSFLNVVEFFTGRSDSVFVDKKGRFSVIEGHASVDETKRRPPASPPNSLRLADVVIPSYPNLPANYSVILNEILDTHVANQKFLTKRSSTKTISTLSATKLLPFNQPQVYTMADIGKIDRRLKDVEYYVTLNTLETGASSKVIPSSVDPTLDRFKFGIFVDDFKSSQFSEISNPQYAALKEGTDIVPLKMKWDLSLYGYGSGDWIDIADPLVVQPIVTVADPFGMGPICALNLANTVAYQLKFRNATDSLANSTTLATIDTVALTFANHTTIQESIQSANGSITQFLQNQQFKLFDGFTGTTHDNFGRVLDLGGEIPFRDLFEGGTGFANPSQVTYNANTKVLSVTNTRSNDHHSFIATIGGVSPAVANALSQLIKKQITFQQFSGLLQVNQVAPTGSISGNTFLPPAVVYFYNYDQGVKLEIFQGTTLIASTDTTSISPIVTPTSLTTEEIALLTGPHASSWFNDFPGLYLTTFSDTGGGYVKNAGKLSFNYAAANGSNFTIKTTRSNNSTRWRWVAAYPINGDSVGCVPLSATPSITGITGVYTNLAFNAQCGNGFGSIGRINVLTGFTATYAINNGLPTTVTVPFDITADWSGTKTSTVPGGVVVN